MKCEKYDHKRIEKKWQDRWEEAGVYHASNDFTKPKYYALVEFPYPSGQGLHVGHPRPYTALDIVARKRRMQGYNVLYPIGWDAFGLPTENYAIKNHVHPAEVTKKNIARFKQQIRSLGISLIGPVKSTPQTRIITNGRSGFSCSSSSTVSPIKKRCPSTGAPPANVFLPMRKSWKACVNAAAALWCIKSSRSGCLKSPRMRIASSTISISWSIPSA